MTSTFNLPPPDQVLERIKAVQLELRELRRLLRASQAAAKADAARQRCVAIQDVSRKAVDA